MQSLMWGSIIGLQDHDKSQLPKSQGTTQVPPEFCFDEDQTTSWDTTDLDRESNPLSMVED